MVDLDASGGTVARAGISENCFNLISFLTTILTGDVEVDGITNAISILIIDRAISIVDAC
jgi:hypothetical protein